MSAEAWDEKMVTARLEKATAMVSDLCHGRTNWLMSIPSDRERDSDLIICASLRDIPKLQQRIRELEFLLSVE